MAATQLGLYGNKGKGKPGDALCKKLVCFYVCLSLLSLIDGKRQFLCHKGLVTNWFHHISPPVEPAAMQPKK